MRHEYVVLGDIDASDKEEFHGVWIDIVNRLLVLEIHGLNIQYEIVEIQVNERQVSAVAQRLPLPVVVSVRVEGTIDMGIHVYAVETYSQI